MQDYNKKINSSNNYHKLKIYHLMNINIKTISIHPYKVILNIFKLQNLINKLVLQILINMNKIILNLLQIIMLKYLRKIRNHKAFPKKIKVKYELLKYNLFILFIVIKI